jgi:hypothetical protein
MTMRLRILLLLGLMMPTLARAGDDQARRHFEAGIALVQKHDFSSAIVELEASFAANPLPETLFDIALCQRELERFVAARANLRRYLDTLPASDANKQKIAEATQLLAQTEAQLATLKVRSTPEGELRVDGELVPLASRVGMKLDPGTHKLEITAAGYQPEARELKMVAGERRVLDIELERVGHEEAAVPAPPAATLATPAFSPPRFIDTAQGRAAIGVGVGALALFVAGAATGGVVLSDKSQYHDSCNTICDGGLYNRAHTIAITTDVLLSVGGAAAVTSLVLFLVHPKHR